MIGILTFVLVFFVYIASVAVDCAAKGVEVVREVASKIPESLRKE